MPIQLGALQILAMPMAHPLQMASVPIPAAANPPEMILVSLCWKL